MKIKEFKIQTEVLIEQFETSMQLKENVIDCLRLYDMIESRLSDQTFWSHFGLNDEDDAPQGHNRLLIPTFNFK